jgi:hypothetical protein
MLLTCVRGVVALGTEDVTLVTSNQPFFMFLSIQYFVKQERREMREDNDSTRLMDLGQVVSPAS